VYDNSSCVSSYQTVLPLPHLDWTQGNGLGPVLPDAFRLSLLAQLIPDPLEAGQGVLAESVDCDPRSE
jgi:hypothetical protein